MDFALKTDNGNISFSCDATDTILNDIILSLTIKAKSIEKDSNGKHVYPGDWWFRPDFGHNCYEVKATKKSDVLLLEQFTLKALKWIKTTGRAKSITCAAVVDKSNHTRVNRHIEAIQANGLTVIYSDFFEVI